MPVERFSWACSVSRERTGTTTEQLILSSDGHPKMYSGGTHSLRNHPGPLTFGEMRSFSTVLQIYCSLSEAGVLAKLVSKHPPSYSKTITERLRKLCSLCWRGWGAMITHSIHGCQTAPNQGAVTAGRSSGHHGVCVLLAWPNVLNTLIDFPSINTISCDTAGIHSPVVVEVIGTNLDNQNQKSALQVNLQRIVKMLTWEMQTSHPG